jgi:hypothetical protein
MHSEEKPDPVAVGQLDWGGLRRQHPLSEQWGFDRGQPIDRYYIENFLASHADLVQGRCIEVMSADYIRRFGGDRVSLCDVVDINPHNARANIFGDLVDPSTLRPDFYDCFILTQTLPVIYDGRALIRNCYAALKPGGTMLVTAPCLCRYSPHPEDYWRLTDRSLTRLIADNTDCDDFEVEAHGNLVASIAFMMGMASVELTQEELDFQDARFPIMVAARVRKRQAP